LQFQIDNTVTIHHKTHKDKQKYICFIFGSRVMALGLDTLAQFGPHFSFSLAPIGNALVDYESSFTAVGINQTHFAVWLTVESTVRIINPVQSSEIIVNRTVSLVDTIISGEVPETYLNMDTPLLNLN